MSSNTPNPYAQPAGVTAEDPAKTLGLIGLILCFFVPLGGLICSIIAKKKSTEAGFVNTPAKVGVILGWIFTILSIIGIIIYIVAIAALVNSGATVDGGITVN